MPFTPSTIVRLCNAPLQSDNKNQLTFATVAAQTAYFQGRTVRTFTDFTYQRKDNIIRVPVHADNLYNVNYVMYDNSNFSAKWFYAFVTEIEYINDNTTALHIKTDVFQTWQFDLHYYDSFVVREHVENDSLYLHTLPEPTPNVEYYHTEKFNRIYRGETPDQFDLNFYCGVYASGSGISPLTPISENYVGGLPSPAYLYAVLAHDMQNLIDNLVQNNYNILFTVAIPKSAVDLVQTNVSYIWIATDKTMNPNYSAEYVDITTDKTKLGNYTIKNNKLNCFPYRAVTMTDRANQSITLKPELMDSERFYIHPVSGAVPSITLQYYSYSGQYQTSTYSVSVADFPPIPYEIDFYKQYMSLHKNAVEVEIFSQSVSAVGSAVGAVSDISKGNVATGLLIGMHGVLGAMRQNAQFDDMKKQPPITHSAPKGAARINNNVLGFAIYDTYIKEEYAKQIDDFFSMYGYNVSVVKNPQFNSRQNWNYIETKDINISGNLPNDDLSELKSIFDSGCTFWHNPATFGDYSQNNPII